jgi:hypothetical protein
MSRVEAATAEAAEMIVVVAEEGKQHTGSILHEEEEEAEEAEGEGEHYTLEFELQAWKIKQSHTVGKALLGNRQWYLSLDTHRSFYAWLVLMVGSVGPSMLGLFMREPHPAVLVLAIVLAIPFMCNFWLVMNIDVLSKLATNPECWFVWAQFVLVFILVADMQLWELRSVPTLLCIPSSAGAVFCDAAPPAMRRHIGKMWVLALGYFLVLGCGISTGSFSSLTYRTYTHSVNGTEIFSFQTGALLLNTAVTLGFFCAKNAFVGFFGEGNYVNIQSKVKTLHGTNNNNNNNNNTTHTATVTATDTDIVVVHPVTLGIPPVEHKKQQQQQRNTLLMHSASISVDGDQLEMMEVSKSS